MNLNKLALEITKREGLKKQVNIAQVKEILGVLSDVVFEMGDDQLFVFFDAFDKAGRRRAQKPTRKPTKSEQRRLEIMGKGKKKAGKR